MLNTDKVDSVAWVYPGAQMSQMPTRIRATINSDTDVLALHLGTNDALNASTEGQALLGVKSALECVERRTNLPIVVCAVPPTRNHRANVTRSKINDYLEFECSRNAHRMTFVNCGLTMQDIGRDEIHMTRAAKQKLCEAVVAAVSVFPRSHSLPSM